jgi:hypothetical protein
MAFIEAPSQDQCLPTWNGDPSMGMDSGAFAEDIAALRAMGGDVVPSFGGYSADHGGTEIAETCKGAAQLAAAYESVITAYDVSRLDMDVEVDALDRTFSIDRRNKALTLVEDWAVAQGRPLQIEYTLPVEPGGLEPNGLYVLQNAVANGTRVDVVNIMTFDYYDGVTTEMGGATIRASRNLHRQLAELYPYKRSAALWAMQGTTILPGIDDYPAATEVTYPQDARQVERFAARKGFSTLATWAAQRDNGGCPGTIDSDQCSGLEQPDWLFAGILNPFTGG